jgi:hypothetical protein
MSKIVPYTPSSNSKNLEFPPILVRENLKQKPKQKTRTVLGGMFPQIISNKKDESSLIPIGFEGSHFFS